MTVILTSEINLAKFSWTLNSVSESKAEVASSKTKILGFLIKALAIAILCFCPPDNLIPLSPTNVFNSSGNFSF